MQYNKRAQDSTGRTFVGIDDSDNDGKYEVVLIFNSKTSTQADAANILRDFGADKVIMFDGGSSTQLICRGTDYVISSSEIPQSIGVVSKVAPPLSATVVSQPNWPVLVEGEDLQIEVEIMNTGSETWDPNRFTFVNKKEPWGANEIFPLSKNVKRGETITFTWTTEQFTKWGVYTTEWHMAKDGEYFTEPVKFSVIVLPKQLEEKRKELEQKIKEWAEEQVENIEERVAEWIQEQIDKKINETCNPAAGLLPIIMLVAFSKIRKPK